MSNEIAALPFNICSNLNSKTNFNVNNPKHDIQITILFSRTYSRNSGTTPEKVHGRIHLQEEVINYGLLLSGRVSIYLSLIHTHLNRLHYIQITHDSSNLVANGA